MSAKTNDFDAFRIPTTEHLLSSFLHMTRGFWRRVGQLESNSMRERLETIPIHSPIYIAGLPRSGSTILLEVVASHDDVATHQYRDFWSIFTPLWSSQAFGGFLASDQQAVERSHGDRIMVTPESPEAIEEMLWMEFFQDLHNPSVSNVLGAETQNAAFEGFYRDHVRKMLMLRKASRYASKANYNATRLGYLHKMFPDVRFVLPFREPRDQIASLIKQHRLLQGAAASHPRSLKYLDRVGHFEFGVHRIPLNLEDPAETEEIFHLWESGEEVRGWARYWSYLYGFVADQIQRNAELRAAAMVVGYEDLCHDSEAMLSRLFSHCELDDAQHLVDRYAPTLQPPSYYRPTFTPAEERLIEQETSAVVDRLALLSAPPTNLPSPTPVEC